MTCRHDLCHEMTHHLPGMMDDAVGGKVDGGISELLFLTAEFRGDLSSLSAASVTTSRQSVGCHSNSHDE